MHLSLNRKLLASSLASLLTGALLAACGGGDNGSNATAPAAAAQAAAKAAPQIPPGKMVLAYYSDYPNNYSDLTKNYQNFNTVSVDFWNIASSGEIPENDDPALAKALAFLAAKKIPAYGCISNMADDWSPSIAHDVTSANRAAAIANLVALAQTKGLAGINIDFENVAPQDRANLSGFAADLGAALHANGLKLIISVPAFSASDENDDYNKAFDLQALGQAVDFIQIMTYDETIPIWSPGPVAGSGWMEDALDYAVSKTAPAKILNGIPAYGNDWPEKGDGSQLFWRQTAALIKQYGATPRYDAKTDSLVFNYTATDGSGTHTVWSENAASIKLKTGLVNAYGLGGTSMYALGMEDSSFWKAFNAGLQN